ncbi:MAG: heme ABC exporter ATP-binding protein CcmA [Rhodospirillaceae bacterium]|nr:heme ABC exporter ATP-binding protein CcmA [Rhodospirillaceae bacterium]
MSDQAGLEVAELGCRRGGRRVLLDVTFAVPRGGALVVTGPNGAGKSTLLRVLAGLCPPSEGRLAIAGNVLAEDPSAYRARVGLLGHDSAIKLTETPAEALRFWTGYAGGRSTASPSDALAAVGLLELAGLPCRHLSAGQRRRLALARLMVRGADLWLLDEPAVGLDADGLTRLGAVLARHRATGGMVVATTHVEFGLGGEPHLTLGPASLDGLAA